MNENQIRILAKFFQKQRAFDDPDFNELCALDDIDIEEYTSCKLKMDFTKAEFEAYKKVIKYVMEKY